MREHTIAVVLPPEYGVYRRILRVVLRAFNAPESRGWRLHWIIGPVTRRAFATPPAHGVIASVTYAERVRFLQDLGLPTINVSGVLDEDPFVRIAVDNEAVGRMAAEHLLGLAYRNFGFVGLATRAYAHRRLGGYRGQLKDAGRDCAALFLKARDENQGWLKEAARWLRSQPLPMAVFADSDDRACGILAACRMSGLRVPDDVAVLGVDDDDLLCESQWPPLTSIRLPDEAIGEEAARRIKAMVLSRKTARPEQVLLPPIGVTQRRSTEALGVQDEIVREALLFLRAQFRRRLKVDHLVEHLKVSRRNLERRFREQLGRGPAEELLRLRTAAALKALTETRTPVGQVARECGFGSATHMGVVVRGATGISPRDVRKKGAGGS